jgi:hypothetical protein
VREAAFLRMQASNLRSLGAILSEACLLLEAELFLFRAKRLEDEAARIETAT